MEIFAVTPPRLLEATGAPLVCRIGTVGTAQGEGAAETAGAPVRETNTKLSAIRWQTLDIA
jgi:hypothetical protein